jgi:hypothetical protein
MINSKSLLVVILTALSLQVGFSQTGQVLTFSEVMFRPSENNGEFIEIYNTSTTETVDLTNFKIKYYTSTADNLVGFIGGMLLSPGKFAVVIENDYDWINGIYKNMIPADAIVLKIADNSFGTSGMANTTSRDINLINLYNQTVDTYTYSADNSEGISDEKYILSKDNSAANWKNSTVSHGTPGKKNSVSPVDYDLRITFFSFMPATPTAEDSLRLTFIVKNLGRLAANNFLVELFHDVNSDTLGQPAENIFTKNYTTLASGDSLIIQKSFFPSTQDSYRFLGVVTFAQDEVTSNNKSLTIITVAEKLSAFNDIVVNEIMYAPSGDEPEWIEIFNQSNRTINLKNWKIGDASALVTISTTDYVLNTQEYLVIAKEATINNYYTNIPKLLIRSIPSLNNSGDDVILKDLYNRKIDSLKYQPGWGGSSGSKSLERISANAPSTQSSNWGTSISPGRATPGRINSLTSKNNDLAVKTFTSNSTYAQIGGSIILRAEIQNLGLLRADNFQVNLFHDINLDQTADAGELINTTNILSLDSGQINLVEFNYQNFAVGNNQFIAVINFALDEYPDNNTSRYNIVGVAINEIRGDLVINEIMYAPNSQEPEWVEIYNRSTKIINMFGYKIADDATTTRVINLPLTLNPNEYLVVAKDSSIMNVHGSISILRINTFASLNNSGDRVVLLDSLNRVIDSLNYKSSWGGTNGKSLERINAAGSSVDSTNWKTSTAALGSTPGRFNSATPYDNDLIVIIVSHSPSFPIKGDSVAINIRIDNIGKNIANNFELEIFNDLNLDLIAQPSERFLLRNYASLSNNQSNSLQTKIFAAEVRLYRIIARINYAADNVQSNNIAVREFNVNEIPAGTNEIVINEIMYAPMNDEPEWIEIYNRSNRALNLKDWKIGDNTALATISTIDLQFNPGEYLVVSSDASISNFYNITSRLIIKSLPSLSNTGEDVKLKDDLNRTIDSLKYLPSWGGTSGKSLERKYTDSLSTTQTNWGTSTSINRATPGLFNSISPLFNNLSVSIISFTPQIPIRNDSVTVNIKIENLGRNTAANFSLTVFLDLNSDNAAQENEKIFNKNFTSLNSFASVNQAVKFFAHDVRTYKIIAALSFSIDEDLSNNSTSKEISVIEIPALKSEIVINEIMYAPAGEEPEWIEIFNRSNRELNLKDWKIGDNTALATISSADLILGIGEYLIISSEANISNFYNITSKLITKSLPSLSNSGDDVKLKDNANRTIDSLKYLSSWGGTSGKSLERKNVDTSSVKSSNWGTSISKFKATPGQKNSLTPRAKDLAVKNFKFNNKYAYDNNSAAASFWIVNNGTTSANQYQYKIYNDFNNDGIYSANELINEGNKNAIVSKDSLKIDFIPSKYNLGENNIYVIIEFDGDENLENNSATAKIIGVYPTENKFDLVINEIMYAPSSPEPEWLEIFNRSNKTINLKGYQIADDASKALVVKSNYFLDRESYAVISRDSNIVYYYNELKNIIVTPFPTLNNSWDRLVLLDSLNRAIDSLDYKSTWGGTGGKSLERIDASRSSADSTNWKTTTAIRGTPQKINSVSKKNFDIAVTRIVFAPPQPIVNDNVVIGTIVVNNGKHSSQFKLILNEINSSGIPIKKEETQAISLHEGGSEIYQFQFNIQNISSKLEYEVVAEFSIDEDLSNNKLRGIILPGYPTGSAVINEIMYSPINSEPEWIEFYNNSNYNIDLSDWSLSDVLTTPVKTKLKQSVIPSKSYFVIAKDSTIVNYHKSIPSNIIITNFANLNNDVDGVVIKDSRDVTVDSVKYDNSWGGTNGKSLERKIISSPSNNKSNWGSSTDIELSTPGRMNSITPYNYDLTVINIGYVPLTATSGDDVNIYARIFNKGLNIAQSFSAEFYFINGTDTSYFSAGNGFNLPAGDTVNILSASKTNLDNPKKVLCKLKYTLDEFLNNNFLTVELSAGFKKNSLVVSEIMYNPYDGESEWIEISNTTNTSINLKDWKVSDLLPAINKVSITSKEIFLQPGEFTILTPDTSKFPYYPPSKFFQVKFGSLGNTSDGIIIYDYRGLTIDSLLYNSNWGGTKGYSLERISLSTSSTDSTNWATSLNVDGASPGRKNSISDLPTYKKGSLIINEIMFDPAAGNSEFVEFLNNSSDSLQLGGTALHFGTDKKVKISSVYNLLAPNKYFVLAADSTIYNNYFFLNSNRNSVGLNSSLSLSNEGSKLVVKDARGTTLDSLYYTPIWHNKNIVSTKNKSLERLNPSLNSNDRTNWNTSVAIEGATPLQANSIFTATLMSESKAAILPNPFSPDGDGFEDFATINFSLKQQLAQVRIKVFDSQGRLVRTIAHNKPSGPNNSIIFDGLDDNGRSLRIGIYILLIEIVTNSGETEVLKLPAVIARRL